MKNKRCPTAAKNQLGRLAKWQVFPTLVSYCRGMTTLPPSSQPTNLAAQRYGALFQRLDII